MRLILASTLALALASPASAGPTPDHAVAAALADPARPAEDVARDAARKPGAVLAFAGVKPGDKVADFVMGGGYFTRILAKAVGPQGRVYGFQPDEFLKFKPNSGDEQKALAAVYANVTPLDGPLAAPHFPEPLDLIFTAQNYHDLHLATSPADTAAKADAALFAALKPGGVLLVVDHAAAAGSGMAAPDKLHRIDPAIVKTELAAAGFTFEAETTILRNPADPHTLVVFDPAIRGHTDQFVYRFRKPR